MAVPQELRQAIDAVRAGRQQDARDLLLKVVERDPENESAWVWLSGLVDSVEDKIVACENALAINPGNEQVRTYLLKLQKEQDETRKLSSSTESQELLLQAKECAKNGNMVRALQIARQAVQKREEFEDAWLLIAELSTDVHQRIAALEKAHSLNPSNQGTRSLLHISRQLRDDPLGLAAHYEQVGKFDEALQVYNDAATRTKDSREFDRIYRQILRVEGLQKEKIQYVAPRTSIARLTFGWPLLYFFLVMVHVGLKPLTYPAFHLWLGLPMVAVGSFLLSLSEVRSKHAIWEKLFLEEGDGSNFARLVTAAAGWMLVIFPHLLLLIDAINRLRILKIPPEPF